MAHLSSSLTSPDLDRRWRIRRGLHCEALGDRNLEVRRGDRLLAEFRLPSSSLRNALGQCLTDGTAMRASLSDMTPVDQQRAPAVYRYVLERLIPMRIIAACYEWSAGHWLEVPVVDTEDVSPLPETLGFANTCYVRHDRDHWVFECPEARLALCVGSPALLTCFVSALDKTTSAELIAQLNHCIRGGFANACKATEHTLCDVLLQLVQCGILQDGSSSTPVADVLEFHDRLFHTWSHCGLPAGGYGNTYVFEQRNQRMRQQVTRNNRAMVADKPRVALSGTTLPPGSLPLWEGRYSAVEPGPGSMDSQLWLNALTTLFESHQRADKHGDTHERRLYPNGGALYEHELWISVVGDNRLANGVYRFDAVNRALHATDITDARVRQYLRTVGGSWSVGHHIPELVITVVNDASRVTAKYEGMAYRLMLMNLGVLLSHLGWILQTQGMASCIITSANPSAFTDMIDLPETHLKMVDLVVTPASPD